MVAQLFKPSLCCSCLQCHVRGEGSSSRDCHCVSGLPPKVGNTAEALQCTSTAGCSWQDTVTSNVSSFSFVFSLTHPILSDSLLAALTGTLKSSPFNFQGAQILSSPEEEAFNWVAVNYVLENFFKVKMILPGAHRAGLSSSC